MPTSPYRNLSRKLHQRVGATAAWDRAVEIIRKLERGRDATKVVMHALMKARDEHLAEIKAYNGGYQDLRDVELGPELDTRIDSMTKKADVEIAATKGRISRSAGGPRSSKTNAPGSSRTPK